MKYSFTINTQYLSEYINNNEDCKSVFYTDNTTFFLIKPTGAGATSHFLNDNYNSIIAVPTIGIIQSKINKDYDKNYFGFYSKNNKKDDVYQYLVSRKQKNLPFKFLVTYESFEKLTKLINDFNKYNTTTFQTNYIVDEYHFLLDQYGLRKGNYNKKGLVAFIEVLKDLKVKGNRLYFISATPLKDTYNELIIGNTNSINLYFRFDTNLVLDNRITTVKPAYKNLNVHKEMINRINQFMTSGFKFRGLIRTKENFIKYCKYQVESKWGGYECIDDYDSYWSFCNEWVKDPVSALIDSPNGKGFEITDGLYIYNILFTADGLIDVDLQENCNGLTFNFNIDDYLNKEKIYQVDEFLIFVNSIDSICDYINACELEYKDFKICASDKKDNIDKIKNKLKDYIFKNRGNDSSYIKQFKTGDLLNIDLVDDYLDNIKIEPSYVEGEKNKRITFITSKDFQGSDFYTTGALSFLVTDLSEQKRHTLVNHRQINQCLGRIRTIENPFRANLIHLANKFTEFNKEGKMTAIQLQINKMNEKVEYKKKTTENKLKAYYEVKDSNNHSNLVKEEYKSLLFNSKDDLYIQIINDELYFDDLAFEADLLEIEKIELNREGGDNQLYDGCSYSNSLNTIYLKDEAFKQANKVYQITSSIKAAKESWGSKYQRYVNAKNGEYIQDGENERVIEELMFEDSIVKAWELFTPDFVKNTLKYRVDRVKELINQFSLYNNNYEVNRTIRNRIIDYIADLPNNRQRAGVFIKDFNRIINEGFSKQKANINHKNWKMFFSWFLKGKVEEVVDVVNRTVKDNLYYDFTNISTTKRDNNYF